MDITNPPQTGPLVIKSLENISKDAFTSHYDLLTKLIGNSHGVYALYDDNELYYVGKSTDLKNRVRQHISDKHLGNWSRFSLYLVREEKHVGEIESLLIRIANPKGNSKKPHWGPGDKLKKELLKLLDQKHKREREEIVGTVNKKGSRSFGSKPKKPLNGLVEKKTPLYRTYKNKDYVADLMPEGVIVFKNKTYHSPTAAAKAVIDRDGAVNGWRFWYVRDASGSLVKLEELRD